MQRLVNLFHQHRLSKSLPQVVKAADAVPLKRPLSSFQMPGNPMLHIREGDVAALCCRVAVRSGSGALCRLGQSSVAPSALNSEGRLQLILPLHHPREMTKPKPVSYRPSRCSCMYARPCSTAGTSHDSGQLCWHTLDMRRGPPLCMPAKQALQLLNILTRDEANNSHVQQEWCGTDSSMGRGCKACGTQVRLHTHAQTRGKPTSYLATTASQHGQSHPTAL